VAREVSTYHWVQSASTSCEYVLRLLADAVEKDEAHYLFFPLCEQGDVLDYSVSRGGLTEPEARPLFAQMCTAVAYLHSLGVVHRDIKLENFFLTDVSDVRLGDMGLASFAPVADGAAAAPVGAGAPLICLDWAGSESYAAPEVWAMTHGSAQAKAAGYDAPPADVWSLGVCLFTMLANFMPVDVAIPQADWRYDLLLQCERSGSSYVRALHEQYARPCNLSAAALDALADMLSTAPLRRPAAAALLTDGWVVDESPATYTAPPFGAPEPQAASASAAPAAPPVAMDISGPAALAARPSGGGGAAVGWTADELHSKLGGFDDVDEATRSRSWHYGGAAHGGAQYCAEPPLDFGYRALGPEEAHGPVEVQWRGEPTPKSDLVPLPPRRQKAREGARAAART